MFPDPCLSFPIELYSLPEYGVGGSVSACGGLLGGQAGFKLSRAVMGAHLSLACLAFPLLQPTWKQKSLKRMEAIFSFASQTIRMLESDGVLREMFASLLCRHRAQNLGGSF